MKRLLNYVRLNVPSLGVTIQAKELLSVLEAQETKGDEVAWGRCLGM